MRVMVTGGTGFVGAHTVKALVDAGHEVVLLARSPERIDSNVKPLGVDRVDYVIGDMTDAAAVRRALAGCDAAVHSAAVVALERRRAEEVLDANPRGTEVVLGEAADQAIDPIVYVSSVSALFSPGVSLLHPELPPTCSTSAYGRSKAMGEAIARRFQDEGAPVTITYPGGVIGPAAGSASGEMAESLVVMLKSGTVPIRNAAVSVIDVRDLAAIHAAALTRGKGARRYVCGGHFLSMAEMGRIYREVTGRRFPVLPIPAPAFRGFGALMDAIMRVVPVDSIFTAEAMSMLTRWCPTDDRAISADLAVALRPPSESFADAIASLLANGRITERQAGAIAGSRGH